MMRSSVAYSPASISSRVENMVSTETSARKPSRPSLTPIIGTWWSTRARAMLSRVPSPPMTMARSMSWAISFRGAQGSSVR